jgi:hypothetical protein
MVLMRSDEAAERTPPNRRAVLKAAAAGGAFAVPLIASFSMDATAAQASPDHHIVSNMFTVSNMLCSNQHTFVPTGYFSAQVAGTGGMFPLFGYVVIVIHGGPRAELEYDLAVPGQVELLALSGPGGGFSIRDGGKHGRIPASQVTCVNNRSPLPDEGLAALYEMLASGQTTVFVDLFGGADLSGTVSFLPAV